MTNKKMEYGELIAFHPGYYLLEQINEMGMSQDEFAKRLDVTTKTLSKLVNGLTPLSKDVAQKLATMLGTSVALWVNLQLEYDLKIIQIETKKKKDIELGYMNQIDYRFFTTHHLLPTTSDTQEKIKNLCTYFRISSLSVLGKPDLFANFRSTNMTYDEKRIINSNAWLQTAMNIASSIDSIPYNEKELLSILPDIRKMTKQNPQQFLLNLTKLLRKCGVTFILLPHLKNSGINGVTKWLTHEKVLLAMNDRRLSSDTFWFSLFHEIKHVLQRKIKITLINAEKPSYLSELNVIYEKEADQFAQDYLIPKKKYANFISHVTITEKAIQLFALELDIHPGILVGRLQHDNHIKYSEYNYLKQIYKIPFNNSENGDMVHSDLPISYL